MSGYRLDRRIQFQKAAISDDGFGEVETFANHGQPLFASKKDLSDAERARAGEISGQITTRFVVRWSPFTAAIGIKEQIICEGVTYNITGIKEAQGRRQWLEITTAAVQ